MTARREVGAGRGLRRGRPRRSSSWAVAGCRPAAWPSSALFRSSSRCR